jgi:hypothetical protein
MALELQEWILGLQSRFQLRMEDLVPPEAASPEILRTIG